MTTTCAPPVTIDHGYPIGSNSPYKDNDVVGYICHDGYASVGSPTVTCNGTRWIGTPKCRLDFIDDGQYLFENIFIISFIYIYYNNIL